MPVSRDTMKGFKYGIQAATRERVWTTEVMKTTVQKSNVWSCELAALVWRKQICTTVTATTLGYE